MNSNCDALSGIIFPILLQILKDVLTTQLISLMRLKKEIIKNKGLVPFSCGARPLLIPYYGYASNPMSIEPGSA